MPYTPEIVQELNTLLHFDPEDSQQGIKVHKTAETATIAAMQRLYAKGLVTQVDGGFMTSQGRAAAEHARAILAILTAQAKPLKALV